MPLTTSQHLNLHLKGFINTIEVHQPQYIEIGSVREFLTKYKLWNQKWFWKSAIKQ